MRMARTAGRSGPGGPTDESDDPPRLVWVDHRVRSHSAAAAFLTIENRVLVMFNEDVKRLGLPVRPGKYVACPVVPIRLQFVFDAHLRVGISAIPRLHFNGLPMQ